MRAANDYLDDVVDAWLATLWFPVVYAATALPGLVTFGFFYARRVSGLYAAGVALPSLCRRDGFRGGACYAAVSPVFG